MSKSIVFKFLLIIGLFNLISCVGPLVPVIDLDQESALRLRKDINVLNEHDLDAYSYKRLEQIQSTSCMNKLWDRPANRDDAIDQLRYKASALGGNGLTNLICEEIEGTNLAKNCWSSVTCYAVAIKTSPNKLNTVSTEKKPDNLSQTKSFPSKQNRFAVIVGISSYQYAEQQGLTNLLYADDDAISFANTLKGIGWSDSHMKVLVNKDATKRNIDIALESWLTKAGPEDLVVLYWSGHGYTDPEDPEKSYFALYDTELNIPATGYRMDKVRTVLEERRARNVILLADTCHAGKLITRGDKGLLSIMPQIARIKENRDLPKGWIFMVGADTDRLAIEHTSWKNGAFTHLLIKGLQGEADGYESTGAKDGLVNMGELREYLNSAMPDETQKVLGVAKRPVITTNSGDPEIWGLSLGN